MITQFKKTQCLLWVILSIGLALLTLGCSNVSSATALKVMTYNIHHGEGTDGKLDLPRIANIIRSAECDIAGLQEVDNNFGDRSNFIDQAKWLAEELDMYCVYGPAIIGGTDTNPQLYGNALLSRFPVGKSKTHKLYLHPDHEPRVCIEALIQINAQDYTFMVTHLDHRSNDVRGLQVADILKITQASSKRTILMGDFNCPPPNAARNRQGSEPVSRILERYKDSFALSEPPQETTISKRRIDYIFVSPDLASNVVSCGVISNDVTAAASDHLPVVAEIAK